MKWGMEGLFTLSMFLLFGSIRFETFVVVAIFVSSGTQDQPPDVQDNAPLSKHPRKFMVFLIL